MRSRATTSLSLAGEVSPVNIVEFSFFPTDINVYVHLFIKALTLIFEKSMDAKISSCIFKCLEKVYLEDGPMKPMLEEIGYLLWGRHECIVIVRPCYYYVSWCNHGLLSSRSRHFATFETDWPIFNQWPWIVLLRMASALHPSDVFWVGGVITYTRRSISSLVKNYYLIRYK
ncbi:hypothetical protein SO802_029897 [Lithocarpus litseifolius]|uniref:Uncharacterized protein n=1 Tax=Lithocarpus litseifolius TaxID=425828 RepID=A0AAW2BWM5_9ROSI